MDIQSIEQAAAAKLDADRNERISFIREIAEASLKYRSARENLTAAESELSQLHRAARNHGWTEKDLKDFGIEPNPKNLGGRPRQKPERRAPNRDTNGSSVSGIEIPGRDEQ
ncbi:MULTISPECIES: hypothetical protein [Paenarthrobacter]|uniref:Uncharacterized protein n=1 Tax=Paenarthrobacter ureafaciens TaxID=37931 RepID=A0AAX3EQ85_PAEUR|nr:MULTISPECIES: hypothetical protein [Paenarthrobacter]MDO5867117.1 hypothetical protein [Paenarthrobacter sp. SD-2]MDO5878371.1 hypothetical protein [Paenarthrobacter sp. SD-1]UYV95598.1 hypothetical protein NL395_23320 [Paenarthrobacter ureafaciens]UYW00282.1 hypothetical protein NL394_24130 [Paenarthrobacter ureafaciens]